MKNAISLIISSKKILVRSLEILLIVTMGLLVVDVLWGVATRHIGKSQDFRTEELARVLLIWVSLLGGAVAYGEKAHLGVDYFVQKMEPSAKFIMKIVIDLVVIGFAIAILLVGGFRLTIDTFHMKQKMMALGILKGYVYLAVPISGIFFLIFAVESFIENINDFFNKKNGKHKEVKLESKNDKPDKNEKSMEETVNE
jgi:TRAP-type C4-dicarboxylate transport system permease small subunit